MSFPASLPLGFRGRYLRGDSDRAGFAEAAGIFSTLPAAVAVPEDAADLAALVRWAAETGTLLVPRGAGTGMPGGNLGSGVVVDLVTGFRGIGEVDTARQRVRVEPGVTLAELNHRCAPHGLQFPVDPSSGRLCTFGGMLANNSAGAHSVKYGATRAWVEALEVVLPDGTRTRTERGRLPEHPRLREMLARVDASLTPRRAQIEEAWPRLRKNSSGYALREYLDSGAAVDLLVGSEGTLALITAAELRLAPLPAARGLAVLEFTSLEAAGTAIQTVLPLRPATCEMLDRTFLELVRSAGVETGYPLRAGLEAILLVEMDGDTEEEVAESLRRLSVAVAEIAAAVTLATEPERQTRFWQVRHAASPLIARRTDGRVSMQFIEDGVVPVERLPEYVAVLRRVLGAHGVPAVIFGHAGDGNLHVNPLVDVSAPGWRETIERILYEIAGEVARLGGTLAGEHGDGRLRAPLLETVWGADTVSLFREVKEAFDPAGILNPGVILPLAGQRPLDAIWDFAAQRSRVFGGEALDIPQ
ncbi:hypothetical protein BH24GEM3_BH24GEM3_22640 [soil metagenome]